VLKRTILLVEDGSFLDEYDGDWFDLEAFAFPFG
jgi:hypothetical protein